MTVLPWAISCSAVLSLRMIYSAVCLVRFMVKSPAQSGRLRTLIHPGSVSGVHVNGANAFWVMGTVRIAVKAAAAMFPIASRPRNVSGFCSLAVTPSTPRCHRVRSCRIWLTRGSLSVQRAASTGYSTTMTRCTDAVAPGSRRSPDKFHSCGPQEQTRCGVGTSPIAHQRAWDLAVPLPGDPRLKQQNISLGCH